MLKKPKSLSQARNTRGIRQKYANEQNERASLMQDIIRYNSQHYEFKYDKSLDGSRQIDESIADRLDAKRLSKNDAFNALNKTAQQPFYNFSFDKKPNTANSTDLNPALYTSSYPTEPFEKSNSPGNKLRKSKMMAFQTSALFIVKEQQQRSAGQKQ